MRVWLLQALECFQKASEAAGGSNSDYTARIKALKQKTSSQHKVAKVGEDVACACCAFQISGPFGPVQGVAPSVHAQQQ